MEVNTLTVYNCTIVQYSDVCYPIAAISEDEAFTKLQNLFPEDIIKRKDVIIENAGLIYY